MPCSTTTSSLLLSVFPVHEKFSRIIEISATQNGQRGTIFMIHNENDVPVATNFPPYQNLPILDLAEIKFLGITTTVDTEAIQFFSNLGNLRDSHAALAFGSSETSEEPSSVTRIISECESALTVLNRNLRILSASIAREQGEKMSI